MVGRVTLPILAGDDPLFVDPRRELANV